MAELCRRENTATPSLHFRVKWIYYVASGYGEAGGFSSGYTYGRCLEGQRGIAVRMLGTSACHRGCSVKTAGCPHALPLPQPLGTAAPAGAPQGAVAASAISRAPLQALSWGSRRCHSPAWHRSSAAPLEALGIRLNRGFGSARRCSLSRSPRRNCRWRLTLHPQQWPGRHSANRRAFPEPPVASPGALFSLHFPAGNEAAAGGLCAGLGGRSLPGLWRLHPERCRVLQHQRGGGSNGAAAPIPAPSVPRRAAPARQPLAGGGTYMLSRKVTAAWHGRSNGSGAEASEAALCQGAPDWLTGLRNGYLVRVKASDWPRGTCNASSEDAGVRVPARCRGAAAAPPGMAARSRRCPQHRQLGRSRPLWAASAVPAEDLQSLRTAAACSNSSCFADEPELAGRSCSSFSDLFRAGFLRKKAAERQSRFSQSFSTAQGARGAKRGRTNLPRLPFQWPCEQQRLLDDRCSE
ncbi:uncharacterized protein LOC121356070 [Pyrgilauda ruficollis]|uniref:uncharacterized protein LOC121356070 n=1 Tax=Pyrgilauda ruficollis TaxID=221976 RepID=UPI001B87EE1C|nr:uncharacterized protein LOC121356070 [Pyrgilauda ruficollis]XP_041328065.1 uncharacterized protein LOC121356070 [Pyrgilauda ruficollis]